MPIRFQCPKCRIRLSVAPRKAGHTSPCPNCRQLITIPAGAPPPLPGATLDSPSAAATSLSSEEPLASSQIHSATPADSDYANAPAQQSPAAHASYQSPATDETWRAETAIYKISPHSTRPSQMPTDSAPAALGKTITFPRWIVYFQAALLGVVATTFFLLGIMIDQNSRRTNGDSTEMYDCQLTGQVVVKKGSRNAPDEGAVVIVVPVDAKLMERPDPQ